MKKKVIGIFTIVAIATVVGYNAYTSQSNLKLSALALANVEALARYEYPGGGILVISLNTILLVTAGICMVNVLWGGLFAMMIAYLLVVHLIHA